ncbi:tetraspanin-32 isoform X1 [Cervus canadensis]|uniref:tetraspanin-32 isoform X1 n=2 Tax=Cervus canadensis TaxID=1574408 RepID=UPI001CA33DDF|nr:tetraspanin-32 isoform X1 [Cervus canadensis]
MEPCRRVRVAKCQMLATSFFVLLLGSAMAATAALSYFGPHFAVIGHVSADRRTYEAVHHWAFFAGIVLAALLTLGAVLSAAATVRGAGGLMAAAFLSFALVFCALAQAALWRLHNPTQVEDAALDAYDRAYDQVVRSTSGTGRQELVAMQDTFWCCGKSSPLGLLGGSEADLCQGEEATRQDCLQGIQSFLRVHGNIVSTLISLGLAFTAYAMLLSSFIWFTIRSGRYSVSQRARSHPPQEPRVYRCIQEGSRSPRRPSKADAPKGRLSPSRCSGQLLLPRDTHPPAHGSGDATVCTRM